MLIRIEWDAQPVRQMFGACNVVADGVATLDDGRRFRINATATRACRKGEIVLRYLTEAKRGAEVPAAAMADVRAAALASFADLLAPMRAAFVAEAQARDAAYMAERAGKPDAGEVTSADGIESGHTGADWEPTDATRFYAQRDGVAEGGPFAFGPTRVAAIEALHKAEAAERKAAPAPAVIPANRHAVAILSGNVDKSNVIGLRKALNADARRSARLSVSPSAPHLQGAELAATVELLKREPLVRGELHASGVRLLTDKRYAKRLEAVRPIIDSLHGFRLVRFDWLDDLHCFPVYRACGSAGSFLFRALPWQAVAFGHSDEPGGPVVLGFAEWRDGPALVANTTRACYWRLGSGVYQATRADDRPSADATAGYPDLGALMRLKGESADTIRRTLESL